MAAAGILYFEVVNLTIPACRPGSIHGLDWVGLGWVGSKIFRFGGLGWVGFIYANGNFL